MDENPLPVAVIGAGPVGLAAAANLHERGIPFAPLLVVELVGPAPYAAVSAHLQRATTLARAGAPLAIGAGAATFGWPATWVVALGAFACATERYLRLAADTTVTHPAADGRNLRPVDVADV